MNILRIIEAWQKSFNPTKKDLERAEHRAEICNGCEYKVELSSALLKNFTKNDKILNSYKCGACGCVLSKKLFAHFKTSCPEGKWDK